MLDETTGLIIGVRALAYFRAESSVVDYQWFCEHIAPKLDNALYCAFLGYVCWGVRGIEGYL